VTDEEVSRAKNILKTQALAKMMDTECRFEKVARKQMFLGEVKNLSESLA
jgi:hypothetical protein